MNNQGLLKPGNVVAIILKKLGYQSHKGCGCRALAEQMNKWGWRGCIRNREVLIKWFAIKAEESGIEITKDSLWALIKGGLKDIYKKKLTTNRASQ
jgi:hypothetical protein